MTNIPALAAKLSEAQRAYMTVKAMWEKPRPRSQARWMTRPPVGTGRVLVRLDLIDRYGDLSDLGLAIRQHIMEQQNERER